MLISPRRTFQSCGSSSRLSRRSKRPTRVTRGSSESLNTGSRRSSRRTTSASRCSASATMVRNLCIWNGRPSRPARVWLKKIGPRLSSRIAIAISGNSGAVTSSPTAETRTSKPRLIIAVERDGSQVSYSSTGRSATRASRTGPARPCSGEITLSFTCRSRQSATRPPTSPGSIRSEAKITRSTPPASASKASISCSSIEAQVHVGEELELAADHLGEVAVAEHRGDLGRRQPPPGPARGAAQRRAPAAAATSQATTALLGADLAGRGLRQHQRQQRHPGGRPGGDRRQLVDGQVADRDVVAVVEADQLRQQRPSPEAGPGPRRRRPTRR